MGRAVCAAGYGSSRAAYESAANGLGMTPANYRRGGTGLTIHYTTATTRFGKVIVGWTEKGVCAVLVGDREESLVESLQAEFPQAVLRSDSSLRARWIGAVLERLDGQTPRVGIPLDLQGTSFQLRVWQRCARSRWAR